ncbi:DNA glycosylase AlkZ-like family protein [Brevibacterium sp. FAM 24630]|uniref:DNA glycosylase AlkZ-like family protein n=1 Tax=unclassified Brevibacterium TaxID=2614124 RepID=UPI003C7AADD7
MLDRERTLAWRASCQALDAVENLDASDIVRRVVAMRGWPSNLAEMTVAVRQTRAEAGALGEALAEGRVIRSYAFRGGSYVFTHEIGALLLSIRTITRVWETRRWQQQGGFALDDWEPLREEVCAVLASGPKTRDEISAYLARIPSLNHLTVGASGAGADSLYKPLHWWGDICFGPTRDGQTTFRLLAGDPRWPGPLDVDEAGRRAIMLYLGAYGPAHFDNLVYWFTEGLGVPRRRLSKWLDDLDGEVEQVTVGSRLCCVPAAALDALRTAEPLDTVRLLPGFDPWVMGPGTADSDIISSGRRALASRGNNLVTWRGGVAGTWRTRGAVAEISWFSEAGPPPTPAIDTEVERLGRIQRRELSPTLNLV